MAWTAAMRLKYWKRVFNKLKNQQNQNLRGVVIVCLVLVFAGLHTLTYLSQFEIKLVARQGDDDAILVEYEYVEDTSVEKKSDKNDLEYNVLNDVEQAQYNYRYKYQMGKKNVVVGGNVLKPVEQKYPNVTRVCSMRERLDHMRKYCERDKIVDDTFQHKDLLVDEKHRILYCAVPRVASTSWRTVLAKATGMVPRNITWPPVHSRTFMNGLGLKFLDDFPKPDADRIAREFYKVIVVRNPFDRLVSAWRDRIIVRNSPSRWTLGLAILAEYRDGSHYELSREWNDTARFFEFAEYLADKEPSDSQWEPISDVCDVCMYKWNAILRVETSYNDSYHLLKRLRHSDSGLPFLHSHLGDLKQIQQIQKPLPDMNFMSEKALQYFKEKYSTDFEIFGYDWNADENRTRCVITTPLGECC